MSYAEDTDDQEQSAQGEDNTDFTDWVVDEYGTDAYTLSSSELREAQQGYMWRKKK